ncbi:MAG: hypothetical protein HOH73_04310, partial [Alphaproteobacteria bacterium]|nr:hypothetical protein [Alphaproteobacteria bacterium]
KSLSEQTIQAKLNSKRKELTELESKKESPSLFKKDNSAGITSLKTEIQGIKQVLKTAKGLSSLNQVTKSVLTKGEPIITEDKLRIVTQSSSPNLDGENLKTAQNAKILTDLISQKLTESKVILQKAAKGQQLSSARDPAGLGGQAVQVASISVNALSAEFLGKIPGFTLAKEVSKAAKVEVDTQLAKTKYKAIEERGTDLDGFAAKFCDSLKYSDAEKPSILATLNEADLVKIAEESVARIYTHIDSTTKRSLEEMVATKKTFISKAQDPTAVGTHLSVDSTRTVRETRTVDGLLSRGGVIVDGVKYVYDKKGADKYGFRVSDKIPKDYLKEQDYKISHGQLKLSDLLERAATQEERNEHDKGACSAEMSQAQAIMQSCLKEGSQTAILNNFLDGRSQAKPQLKDKTQSTFSEQLTKYKTAKAKLAEINAEPKLARESEVGERKFADPVTETQQKPESLAQVVKNLFKKESPAQQQPAEQQQVEQQPAEQQPSRKYLQMFKSVVSKMINKDDISQEVRFDKVYPENGSVGIENPMLQSNGGAKFEPERSSLSSGASSDRSLSTERLSEILEGENVGALSEASVAQQQGGAVQVENAGTAQSTVGIGR